MKLSRARGLWELPARATWPKVRSFRPGSATRRGEAVPPRSPASDPSDDGPLRRTCGAFQGTIFFPPGIVACRIFAGPYPVTLAWTPGADKLKTEESPTSVFVLVDSGSADRRGELAHTSPGKTQGSSKLHAHRAPACAAARDHPSMRNTSPVSFCILNLRFATFGSSRPKDCTNQAHPTFLHAPQTAFGPPPGRLCPPCPEPARTTNNHLKRTICPVSRMMIYPAGSPYQLVQG